MNFSEYKKLIKYLLVILSLTVGVAKAQTPLGLNKDIFSLNTKITDGKVNTWYDYGQGKYRIVATKISNLDTLKNSRADVKAFLSNNKNVIVLGLEINPDKEWYTYSDVAGAFGIDFKIKSSKDNILPIFPTPKFKKVDDELSYIYEDSFTIPIIISYDSGTTAGLDLSFGTCKVSCVPKNIDFNFVIDNSEITTNNIDVINALNNIPVDINTTTIKITGSSYQKKNDNYFLTLRIASPFVLKNPELYIVPEGKVATTIPPKVIKDRKNNNEEVFEFKLHEYNFSKNASFLIKDNNFSTIGQVEFKKVGLSSTWWFLLIAFTGGLILNLMPCVFPILMLKLKIILQKGQSGIARADLRKSFALSGLGVIFCFAILGLIFMYLKSLGGFVTWGGHFQNKYFVLIVALLLGIMGIAQFGLIKIPYMIINFSSKNVALNSFLDAFLITLMATPCTAPFLTTAVFWGLTEGGFSGLLIFIAIATGLALPWLLTAIFPSWLNLLPKSGTWLRNVSVIAGICLLISSVFFGYSFYKQISTTKELIQTEKKLSYWQNFSQDNLEKLLQEGKTVIVNATASWCITCQVNNKFVWESETVRSLAKNNDKVKFLEADFTNPSEEVNNFLNSNNAIGVPTTIVFSPDGKKDTLSTLLTTKELLDILGLRK